MRRLQSDWWEHGSRINPRSVYRHWKENGGTCSLRSQRVGWSYPDDYGCPCFDLTDKGAYIFKNHPTGTKSRSAYKKEDDWYGYSKKVPYRVARKMEATEKTWPSKRSKKVIIKDWKICCHGCGYLVEIVSQLSRDDYDKYIRRFHGHEWRIRCIWCQKRDRARRRVVQDTTA